MSMRISVIVVAQSMFTVNYPYATLPGNTLYVNNEFECVIRGSKHEKTV